MYNNTILALSPHPLLWITSLLRVDHCSIVILCHSSISLYIQGSTDVAKDSGRLEPYIAVVGKESLDAYLVVDQQVIDEVPIDNLPMS